VLAVFRHRKLSWSPAGVVWAFIAAHTAGVAQMVALWLSSLVPLCPVPLYLCLIGAEPDGVMTMAAGAVQRAACIAANNNCEAASVGGLFVFVRHDARFCTAEKKLQLILQILKSSLTECWRPNSWPIVLI
jgi:hypothetical protein